METAVHDKETCKKLINAAKDALYVLNGKWKILVIIVLADGPKRFNEIERELEGITPKVLSRELKDLELNEFIERRQHNGSTVQVTYALTPYSDSLREIIGTLSEWGRQHKQYILNKRKMQQTG
jgi:DNA-binding HxlR family transcriptional regulator